MQRIAETLRYLKHNFGKDEEGFIKMILTREDIANLEGTAKGACIRHSTAFKKSRLDPYRGQAH